MLIPRESLHPYLDVRAFGLEIQMLDLEPAEEHVAVAELARSVAIDVLGPAARDAEASNEVPPSVWQKVFETGLAGSIAESHGGGGVLDAVTEAIAVENLAYGDPGITLAAFWSGAAAYLLGMHGTAEQSGILRTVASDAAWRGSVALYEGYGRSPHEFTTTIDSTDAGRIRIVGRKVVVPYLDQADSVIVVGVDPAGGGVRAAIVPITSEGLTIERDDQGLALDAVPTFTVSFDLELTADHLLGGEKADPVALANSVERMRLVVASALVGTAQRAVEYASQYATERVAFGRPISGFQGVSFLMADAQMRVEASRLEIAEAASLIDQGDSGLAAVAVTRAVNYAGEVASDATRNAVQVLGGHGFITDHPVELWYRSAAALSTLDFDPLCSSFEPVL